jgi:hypothetical protein
MGHQTAYNALHSISDPAFYYFPYVIKSPTLDAPVGDTISTFSWQSRTGYKYLLLSLGSPLQDTISFPILLRGIQDHTVLQSQMMLGFVNCTFLKYPVWDYASAAYVAIHLISPCGTCLPEFLRYSRLSHLCPRRNSEYR